MLAKVHRLSQDRQIQAAFRTKHRTQTEHTKIFVNRSVIPEFQLLIIVPKKVFKKANKRNRLRRKISAVFEDLLYKKRLPPYTTCIVQTSKKELICKTVPEIADEIVPQISLLYSKMIQQKPKSKKIPQPS